MLVVLRVVKGTMARNTGFRLLSTVFIGLTATAVLIMACWCVTTVLFGLIIEQWWAPLQSLGVDPVPMLEWFFSTGGARLMSITDVGYGLVGFSGPMRALSGLPVPYPVRFFFGSTPQYFGGKFHTGVDLGCPVGTPVVNVMAGQVTFAGWSNAGYGYLVVVENQGVQSFYGHLSRIDVRVGDVIDAGVAVGLSGNTGYSTGPHLHWEVRQNGVPVDPLTAVLPGE